MFFYVLAKRFADVLLKVELFLENKKISSSRPIWPVKLPMCETKNRYTVRIRKLYNRRRF